MTDKERTYSILVVDDEMVIRDVLEDYLSDEGYEVVTVPSAEEALEELEEEHYDIVLSDLMMPGMSGLDLINVIAERKYSVIPIIMTGYGTIETAVDTMRTGAFDYVLKPFKMAQILKVLEKAIEHQNLKQENFNLKETISLYKISESLSTSGNPEKIIDTVLDAVAEENEVDYAIINFYEESNSVSGINERFSDSIKHLEDTFCLDIPKIMRELATQSSIIVNGDKILNYFSIIPTEKKPVSLCAASLKVPSHSKGFFTIVSFDKKHHFNEGHRKFLTILATKTAVAFENSHLIEKLRTTNQQLLEANHFLEENFRQTILGFARAIEQNDPYTRGHSDRVARYSEEIAKVLNLSESEIEDISFAGQLHDIGKIGISPQKLNKAGKLNAPEIHMFRKHPEMGKRILEPIPFMRHLIPGVYCHHEKWDGTGYPQGLKGEEIPLMGRIIAVADTYDAMTSDRSYRKALSREIAVEELKANSGTQFDPVMVEAFLKAMELNKI